MMVPLRRLCPIIDDYLSDMCRYPDASPISHKFVEYYSNAMHLTYQLCPDIRRISLPADMILRRLCAHVSSNLPRLAANVMTLFRACQDDIYAQPLNDAMNILKCAFNLACLEERNACKRISFMYPVKNLSQPIIVDARTGIQLLETTSPAFRSSLEKNYYALVVNRDEFLDVARAMTTNTEAIYKITDFVFEMLTHCGGSPGPTTLELSSDYFHEMFVEDDFKVSKLIEEIRAVSLTDRQIGTVYELVMGVRG